MRMTLEEFAVRFPDRPPPVPAEYAGEWIAWNPDRSAIVAHGKTLDEVCRRAVEVGYSHPILQKIPRGPFVGSA